MRRNSRGSGSAGRGNGAPIPDAVSLLRSFNLETNPARPVRPSPLTASIIPDMPLDLLDRIRSFPLFLSAPDTFLAAIGKHLRPQVHSPHDHILTEGDDAKAMYWLVRGAVAVTSRDGEATYAELKPGAFFGEIGILMEVPRTATIIARSKCLLVVLKKEDLRAELPNFPAMERAIREEAQERLTILNRKRRESGYGPKVVFDSLPSRGGKVAREAAPGEVSTGDMGSIEKGAIINHKKRKSPSPGIIEDPNSGSALGSGLINVRKTLKDLPLFSTLPPEILHFLGLNAQPCTYPPFTDIIVQGSPGNEIYFIVRGEAEVIHEPVNGKSQKHNILGPHTRPRLKQGQYFGEVASLALAPRRTATVRSITNVECLKISGKVLSELWNRCTPNIRAQVERTAKERIAKPVEDVEMTDVSGEITTPAINTLAIEDRKVVPQVTFTPSKPATSHTQGGAHDSSVVEPMDPDPFLSVDMDNMRRMGRRSSLAPPPDSTTEPGKPQPPLIKTKGIPPAPERSTHSITPPDSSIRPKRLRTLARRPSQFNRSRFSDQLLIRIFMNLDIYHLMRLRLVSTHWRHLLTATPSIAADLDLSVYNRFVTNQALIESIIPFVGTRPHTIDVSNCFHITDEGFSALTTACGSNVQIWKMKSVWDISPTAVLDMANTAKDLEEIDLSNCRKVSDNLLARIVGWVVADPLTPPHSNSKFGGSRRPSAQNESATATASNTLPPPGTVVGCPNLHTLTLSYCKHVTDRSMAHLAVHAHTRLASLDLTRCTTITDSGFQHWSIYRFARLTTLCLADCTYLTDNAIVYLTNAAKNLQELDLSFCCALSDTATEVLALGLPQLRELKMAFCGSAVSDSSLRCVGLHLLELERLSVRGCVRVTGVGVEAVVEGCGRLETLDVSQCKNLGRWLANGGVERVRKRKVGGGFGGMGGMMGMGKGRDVTFITEKGEGDGKVTLR